NNSDEQQHRRMNQQRNLGGIQRPPKLNVGVYGWRKRCLYCLLVLLTIIVCINLCLTLWLTLVLGLHWGGVGIMSLHKNHIVFNGPTVFKNTLYTDEIRSGDKSGTNGHYSKLVIDKSGINANCEQFQINDRSGQQLIAVDSSEIRVFTNDMSIISATEGRLTLSSNNDIDMIAQQTIDFVANNIVLKGHSVRIQNEHIYLEKLHFFDRSKAPYSVRNSQSYQVCVCENGLLFAAVDCRQATFDCRE
ncbi:unnamed protein product, partial [Didymodactylos carnosus]